MVRRAELAWIVGCMAIALTVACNRPVKQGDAVKERFDREFPIGTDALSVLARLDSMKVEHSSYDPEERLVLAILRDTSQHQLVRTSKQVIFRFDVSERLQGREYRDVHTGP